MAIARIALPVAAEATFDYWIPEGLVVERGALVRVRLARRSLTGVVVDVAPSTDVPREKLQPIDELRSEIPALPADVLELARFVATYYQEPLGLALAQMLPPLASAASRKVRAALPQDAGATDRGSNARAVSQNPEQQRAGEALSDVAGSFAPCLLQGVTGSGKTEVYLSAAAERIAADGQVLILVPEINLTPQFHERIRDALPGRRTVTLHSRLSPAQRRANWCRAATGEADLVLGTRLAVFTPLPRLSLIVVDEEHDPSFKQQDGVRYSGRDVAVWRARQRAVPVVLGSATPSLESLTHAQAGRYRWLKLPRRAAAPARLPDVRLAANRDAGSVEGMGAPLLEAIAARLARGEQSLVFINRRGFAVSLLCSACGWQAGCPRCSARLVVHRETADLRCHHCGHTDRLARTCPDCGNVDLVPVGYGTQRLERALAERFSQARIERIDRDSTRRKGAFADVRERVHAGEVDILVGTQMLAKGHDFPRLTLVGVLGADNALYSGDFRATERLASLLFQVAGRAGRADLAGEVIVQTDFPAHPLARALVAHDYESFAESLLAEREAAMLPPFACLALLTAEATRRDAVDGFLAAASEAGRGVARAHADRVEVFAPVPAALPRRAGLERGQVLARAVEKSAMQRFLPRWRAAIAALPGRRVRAALDVDPLGFA